MSKPADLVQGTLDMLLLKILALQPLNGFSISQRLRQMSSDVLQVSDGSLYPALHKLENEGLDQSRVENYRQHPAREILFVDEAGTPATRKASRKLESAGHRDSASGQT